MKRKLETASWAFAALVAYAHSVTSFFVDGYSPGSGLALAAAGLVFTDRAVRTWDGPPRVEVTLDGRSVLDAVRRQIRIEGGRPPWQDPNK